jgi:hypothetical protein
MRREISMQPKNSLEFYGKRHLRVRTNAFGYYETLYCRLQYMLFQERFVLYYNRI